MASPADGGFGVGRRTCEGGTARRCRDRRHELPLLHADPLALRGCGAVVRQDLARRLSRAQGSVPRLTSASARPSSCTSCCAAANRSITWCRTYSPHSKQYSERDRTSQAVDAGLEGASAVSPT